MTLEKAIEEYGELCDFVQNDDSDIFWTYPIGVSGVHLFSFDQKNVYNLFSEFPYALSDEQVALFCKNEPYWANAFADRLAQRGIKF